MSILDSSIAVLNAGLRAVSGVTATYRRGNDAINPITVVPLATRHDGYGDEETNFTARDRDWLIWATDLVIGGVLLEPQKNDAIDITTDGVTRTYEVLPRDDDRCYRHTDQTHQQFRVYTVEALPSTE